MIEYIGYLGTTLSLLGAFLNARKKRICWTIWLVSNVVWVIYGLYKPAPSVIALNITFACVNVYGLINWRKNN